MLTVMLHMNRRDMLTLIRDNPATTVQDVVNDLGVLRVTAQAMLIRLYRQGLLSRHGDAQEPRRYCYSLTDAGQRRLNYYDRIDAGYDG